MTICGSCWESKASLTFFSISGSRSSGIVRQASTNTISESTCCGKTCLQIWTFSSRTCSGFMPGVTFASHSSAVGVRRSPSSTTSGPTRATTFVLPSDSAPGTGGPSSTGSSNDVWMTPVDSSASTGSSSTPSRGSPGIVRIVERTWLSPVGPPGLRPGQDFGRVTGRGMCGVRFVVVVDVGDGPLVIVIGACVAPADC